MELEAQRHVSGALDAVDANFAVALRGVGVARGKERAGIQHGQVKRGSGA